jgi:hypothetical protein
MWSLWWKSDTIEAFLLVLRFPLPIIPPIKVIRRTEETQLLNKGLKYNLHHKRNNWIHILAIEAEVVARDSSSSNLDIIHGTGCRTPK